MPTNPKTIATINFKGGVGKTTVTWCLGDVVSAFSDARVLLFDLDAQMSLTQAIALNEDGYSPKLPDYDYILFDCPPSFTLLSYSVLSCCDLILIPVNPDYFASKGTNLILNSLKMRIEPFPLPRIGVFMNKTKTWRNAPTREALFYIREIERVCNDAAKQENIDATFLHSWIPERVGVKRAITAGGVPAELVDPFKNLWNEIVEYVR